MSEPIQPDKLLSFPELKEIHGIRYCRMQIYRLEHDKKFPRRLTFGRHVYWKQSEIIAYIDAHAAARAA